MAVFSNVNFKGKWRELRGSVLKKRPIVSNLNLHFFATTRWPNNKNGGVAVFSNVNFKGKWRELRGSVLKKRPIVSNLNLHFFCNH